ncbi:MAG: aminoacyl-tRNA hydrolase [Paracoccaceae bacterium]
MKLLVGLGNPGEKYKLTRHNVGFMVLDRFISKLSIQDWDKKFDSRFKKIISNEKRIILIKPLTYMNLSGYAVQKARNFYNIDNNNIIIIHDDIDLELGRVKLKNGGGDSGHNGLKSVIKNIGNEFIRIRIGVGRPEKIDVSAYVLNNFFKKEISLLEEVIQKSCEGIKLLIEDKNEHCKKLFSESTF